MNNSIKGCLICKCKGGRKYVHGTDIYNLFFNEIKNNYIFSKGFEKISISFKKIIMSKHVYFEVYNQKFNDKDASAIIRFTSDKNEYFSVLKPSAKVIEESYNFNENDITKYCVMDVSSKSIVLSERVVFTPIEIYTAMNKRLLNFLFGQDKKWLMTKFELKEYSDNINYKEIYIVMKKTILLKLIKSDIYADKVKIGSIYFSESK
jgi:hypothetical protein